MRRFFFLGVAVTVLLSPLLAAEGVNQKELKELLGDSYMIDQDYVRSAKEYREVLAKDPQNTKARTSLADVLSWEKQYDEAIREYLKVLRIQPKDLEVKKKLAAVYAWNKDFVKAEVLYQEVLAESSLDPKQAVALAEVCFRLGKTPESRRLLKEIIEKDPENTEAKVLLGDICAAEKDFKKSLELYHEVVAKKYDRKIKAKIGDVLSWTRDYEGALRVYDELLAEKEDKFLMLQKARILGWERKYGEATEEYRKILSLGPDELVQKEMEAKQFYWDNRVERAIKAYKDLLAKNPENAEAMFDLSQVYSYQSMWGEAIRQYKELLDLHPDHFRAREGLEKSKLIAAHPSLDSGYEFFKAHSGSRDVDIHKNIFRSLLDIPLNRQTFLGLGYQWARRAFRDFHSLTENHARVSLSYEKKPGWSAGGFFNLITYRTSVAPVYEFGGQFAFRTFDIGQMTLSAGQQRLENNSEVIRQRTMRDDFKIRQDLDLTKRWKAGADYTFSYFTDHNHENETAADTLYFLILEPTALYVKYRYAFRNYGRRDDFYYAPHNYSLHTISVRWKHFLNQEEIFFGANDIYYEAGYDFLMDSTGIISHQVLGGLGWDITKRLQIKGEGQYTHATTRIYEDVGAKGSVKYFF